MHNIEFENVDITYSKLTKPTIKNINFKIKENSKTLIVGRSGCGKSTLAKSINGLIPNSITADIKGSIKLQNTDTSKFSIFDNSKIVSTIMQDQDSQFVGLSVAEDVAFIDENNKVDNDTMKQNVETNLKKLDILNLKDLSPTELSGGQKQRVSLSGLLSSQSDIFLFDEPLANLDPKSSYDVLNIISKLNQDYNKTIVVIEHRIEDVLRFDFDRVIVMLEGEIIFDGDVDKLLKSNTLQTAGLRKPLHLEFMDKMNIDYQSINNIYDPNSFNKQLLNDINFNTYEKIKSIENKSILEFNSINFKYGERHILHDVSFNIKKGQITTLLGNNGSGKSTILNLITGLLNPLSGTISFKGESLLDKSIFTRGQHIGYVMQNPNHMITKNTVYDEVSYSLKLKKVNHQEIDVIVDEILEKCNLLKYKKWPIEMLSYGQKRRVTIASVLVNKPDILLLDEPTAGQDYQTFKSFMQFIKELTNDEIAILIITHNMQLAIEYSNETIILDHGHVTAFGNTIEVFSNTEIFKNANLNQTTLNELAKVINVNPVDLIHTFNTGGKNG